MTGMYKAWGGNFDFCEHGHESIEAAEACAKATGRAFTVDVRTMGPCTAGGLGFTAHNVAPYVTGGETVSFADLGLKTRGEK